MPLSPVEVVDVMEEALHNAVFCAILVPEFCS